MKILLNLNINRFFIFKDFDHPNFTTTILPSWIINKPSGGGGGGGLIGDIPVGNYSGPLSNEQELILLKLINLNIHLKYLCKPIFLASLIGNYCF